MLFRKIHLFQSPLVRDSIWAVFGNVVGKGFSFAAGIAVARYLGKVGFGEYGLITSTLLSASIFSTFGLGYTATKFISDYRINNQSLVGDVIFYSRRITFIVSGCLAFFLFVFSDYLAGSILNANHLSTEFKLVSIWVVFNALTTTQIGVLAGFGLFKAMVKVNAIVGISTFLFSVSFTYFLGMRGALLALLINQILNWYLNNRLMESERKKYPILELKNKSIIKELFHFSVPIAFQEALYALSMWSISLSIVKFSNVGEFGMYQVSVQISSLILFVPGILRNVFLAHFSMSENSNENNRLLKTTILINSVSVLLPVLFVLVFIKPIVQLYGNQFDSNLEQLVIIASCTSFFISLINVYNQLFLSKGRNWFIFWSRFVRDLVVLMFFIVFIKDYKSSSILMSNLNLYSAIIYLFVLIFVQFKLEKAGRVSKINT